MLKTCCFKDAEVSDGTALVIQYGRSYQHAQQPIAAGRHPLPVARPLGVPNCVFVRPVQAAHEEETHQVCVSAWGPDAYAHGKPLKLLWRTGSLYGAELQRDGSLAELMHARSAFGEHPRLRSRINLYLATHGDLPSIHLELTRAMSAEAADAVTRVRWLQFAVGCLRLGEPDGEPDLEKIAAEGLIWVTEFMLRSAAVLRTLSGIQQPKSAEEALLNALSARATSEPDDDPFDPTVPLEPPRRLVRRLHCLRHT